MADPEKRIERLALEANEWPPYLFTHLTLLHGVIPDTLLKYSGTAYLSPAWSLSLEWQFYLVAPWLVAGCSGGRWTSLNVGLLILSALALGGLLGSWQYPSFLPLALPFFSIGITSRLVVRGHVPKVAIALTLLSVVTYLFIEGRGALLPMAVVLTVWLVFLLITAREMKAVSIRGVWFDRVSYVVALNPVMRAALGRVSYSTYLAHIPIISIVVGGGMALTGRSNHAIVSGLIALSLLLSAGLSFVLWRHVEKRGEDWGKSYVKRLPVDDQASA